jgi:hypothetical protein
MKNSLPAKAGLVAGLFFPLLALATTFGPIPVYKQAENSQYYVHGRVVSGPETRMEPRLGRPYTYWAVEVSEQPLGDPLGDRVTVREPGGEVGDMGYHVAGTAEFTAGEEVYIALHDTDEAPGIKEVVGLASGKYRVETGAGGKPVVRNGLGVPVTGSSGVALSPDEFSALLRRVAAGETTEADRTIFVTRKPSHELEETAFARALPAARRPAEGAASAPAPASHTDQETKPSKPALDEGNPIQQSASQTEETSTGSSSWGWVIALGVLVGLVLGLFLALR